MRKCELCKLPARLYCESDQACLCPACDLKVHAANFLVARHTRTLLCKTCQAPTPWVACGTRLGNTVTECETCVRGDNDESDGEGDEVFSDDEVVSGGDSDGSDEDCDEDGDEEEEGENQIVPGSYSPNPPPAASSSIGDESSSSYSVCASRTISAKRMRERDADRQPQNDFVASCSRRTANSATSHPRLNSDEDDSFNASKSQRIMEASRSGCSPRTQGQGLSKTQP
ncbi:hypothetical protein QQ045_009803 [Rhodiola kirilowii]